MRYFGPIAFVPRAAKSHALTTGSDSVFLLSLEYMRYFRTYGQDTHVLVIILLFSLTPHQHGLLHPSKSLSSAYCVRKALATGTIDTSKPLPTVFRGRCGC